MMTTYKPMAIDGCVRLTTTATCTHQQGTWRWQIRLCTVRYAAVYSSRIKAWLWKSLGQEGACFSGGNIRSGGWTGSGSRHNKRLTATELAALATLRGESWIGDW